MESLNIVNYAEKSWGRYKGYVQRHKQLMSTIEHILQFCSFLVPGRYGDSPENSEFLYSLSHLLKVINGRALGEERIPTVYVGKETLRIRNIKTFIQIVQYLQLFIELLSNKKNK